LKDVDPSGDTAGNTEERVMLLSKCLASTQDPRARGRAGPSWHSAIPGCQDPRTHRRACSSVANQPRCRQGPVYHRPVKLSMGGTRRATRDMPDALCPLASFQLQYVVHSKEEKEQ
jgi:hypothetical protein